MAIAVWTESNLACPYCQNSLRRGVRRFGPAKVKCHYCNKELETGLVDIFELPTSKKFLFIILDLLFPSYYRGINQPAKLFVMLFHLYVIIGIPIMTVIAMTESDGIKILPLLLLWCVYPILHIVWLWRMVNEAKYFHESQTVPTWKAPFITKKATGFSFRRIVYLLLFLGIAFTVMVIILSRASI